LLKKFSPPPLCKNIMLRKACEITIFRVFQHPRCPPYSDCNLEGGTMIPRNINLLRPTEWFRIGLAVLLLGLGFGLAALGWANGNDRFFHLGLALGPAGLVAVTFEYLIRVGLEARSLESHSLLAKDTLDRLKGVSDDLRQTATFDLDRGKLGLIGIYADRADAVRHAVSHMIDRENKAIYIVGSTLYGLNAEWTDGMKTERLTPECLLRRIADRKKAGCDVFVLLTDPVRVFERHRQEAGARSADRGTIVSELRHTCSLLAKFDLAADVYLYDGAPTCFTIAFIGQRRMVVNPYPYQAEAYKSWAIMIEDRDRGIYQPFLHAHVLNPLKNNELVRKLTTSVVDDFERASKEEERILDEAEQAKAEQDAALDQRLKSGLPDTTSSEQGNVNRGISGC